MATSGLGMTLTADAASVGEIISIDGPNVKGSKIDTSHAGITTGFKTAIAGLNDPGDLKVELNWTKADYDAAWDLAVASADGSDAFNDWVLTLADTHTWSFAGFVSEVGNKMSYDDKVTFSITVSISGKPTYA